MMKYKEYVDVVSATRRMNSLSGYKLSQYICGCVLVYVASPLARVWLCEDL